MLFLGWKMRALVRLAGWPGKALFIKWMAVYRAELLRGALLSALLKAIFCRYPSGEKKYLFLKIPP